MIKPLLFTYLFMVVLVLWMDFKHLKQAAAINRWISYSIMGFSTGIFFYVTHLSKTFFVTVWLTHFIQHWLPLP